MWRKAGIDKWVWEAYERGAILAGLSAGAICWFRDMYTDSLVEGEFCPAKGMDKFPGAATPHYNQRTEFDDVFAREGYEYAYAIEDDAALLFEDGEMIGALSAGGRAYKLTRQENGEVKKEEIAAVCEN